jgi:preprotein translocase subunit YajC
MPQAQPAISPIAYLFLWGPILLIFYFLLIRPQQKERQTHQKMLAGLSKNDDIVTTGGLHGTVVNVKEKTIILRVDENVKIEIEKNCVAYVKKTQA